MKELVDFFSGVREEFSRVTWPTRLELFGTTVIVLLLVLFFAVYVGVINYILQACAARIF